MGGAGLAEAAPAAGYAGAELLNRRLAEEMEANGERYQKDLSDRNVAIHQTRKKLWECVGCTSARYDQLF